MYIAVHIECQRKSCPSICRPELLGLVKAHWVNWAGTVKYISAKISQAVSGKAEFEESRHGSLSGNPKHVRSACSESNSADVAPTF